jgi:hypothetical protein
MVASNVFNPPKLTKRKEGQLSAILRSLSVKLKFEARSFNDDLRILRYLLALGNAFNVAEIGPTALNLWCRLPKVQPGMA